MKVEPDCTLPGHPEVFVIGDLMSLDRLPGVAQVAHPVGPPRRADDRSPPRRRPDAPAIPLPRPRDDGDDLVLARDRGHWEACASPASTAWVLWLLVHLMTLTGFKNRLSVLFNWMVAFLGRGRAERVITAQQVFARHALEGRPRSRCCCLAIDDVRGERVDAVSRSVDLWQRTDRRQRHRANIRRAILATARELFVSEGFRGVSLRQIADRLEYSPAALYTYFCRKDDILLALAREDAAGLERQVHEATRDVVDPLARVRRALSDDPRVPARPPAVPGADGPGRARGSARLPRRRQVEWFSEVAAIVEAAVCTCMERGQFSTALTAAATCQLLWAGYAWRCESSRAPPAGHEEWRHPR